MKWLFQSVEILGAGYESVRLQEDQLDTILFLKIRREVEKGNTEKCSFSSHASYLLPGSGHRLIWANHSECSYLKQQES